MTNMTPALVDRLRAAPTEDQHLEFKEAKTAFDKEKLRDYCVALANEGGGYLVLGVSNNLVGRARAVVGTRAFSRPIELERYILESCKFRVDVGEVVHPDGARDRGLDPVAPQRSPAGGRRPVPDAGGRVAGRDVTGPAAADLRGRLAALG
jgi:hypothetical protein